MPKTVGTGTHWCPDPGLRGGPSRHHPLSYWEHVFFSNKSFGGDVSHVLLKCKAVVKLPNIQTNYIAEWTIVDVCQQHYISVSVFCISNLIVKALTVSSHFSFNKHIFLHFKFQTKVNGCEHKLIVPTLDSNTHRAEDVFLLYSHTDFRTTCTNTRFSHICPSYDSLEETQFCLFFIVTPLRRHAFI